MPLNSNALGLRPFVRWIRNEHNRGRNFLQNESKQPPRVINIVEVGVKGLFTATFWLMAKLSLVAVRARRHEIVGGYYERWMISLGEVVVHTTTAPHKGHIP